MTNTTRPALASARSSSSSPAGISARAKRLRSGMGKPRLDLRPQHWKAHRAASQGHVMEGALVEAPAQARLGLRAQRQDLTLPDLVGQRLAGPADVAIDLGDDVVVRRGSV